MEHTKNIKQKYEFIFMSVKRPRVYFHEQASRRIHVYDCKWVNTYLAGFI